MCHLLNVIVFLFSLIEARSSICLFYLIDYWRCYDAYFEFSRSMLPNIRYFEALLH